MNFPDVKGLAIREGRVRRVLRNGEVLWDLEKVTETDLYPLCTHNYWISTAGKKSGIDDNWISSEKIPVADNAAIDYYLYPHSNVGNVVAYDAAGNVLGYSQNGQAKPYRVPPGTTHITLTGCTAKYNSSGFNRQYVTLFYVVDGPPRYIEDGLVLWCDGIDNTGVHHSSGTTVWKDLSGNGNDIINAESKTTDRSDYDQLTTPAGKVKGEWRENGIAINAPNRQMLRTPNVFDLGADYTIEMRVSQLSSNYMTCGFKGGTRFKLRMQNAAWWVRVSESDADGQQNINPYKTMVPLNTPVTYTVSRFYDANANRTEYRVYADGVYLTLGSYEGIHRDGESAYIAVGMEEDDLVVHSVRLYNRALSAEEIAFNHEYDTLRFWVNEEV